MPHIEVDEVFGLVGDVGSEVSANDTVPGGIVLLIELLLDVGGNILFDIELLQGDVGAIYCVLLHFLVHVSVLYHCLAFSCRHNQLN